MPIIELQAIYTMWLRQIKRFMRSKSRVIATFIQPLFFLALLGSGLRGANLERTNFSYADLLLTNLSDAFLRGVNFYKTAICGTAFQNSVLADANFSSARFMLASDISSNIILGYCINFSGVDLSETYGLDSQRLMVSCGDSLTILPDEFEDYILAPCADDCIELE